MNTFVNQDNLSRRMSTIKHKIVVLSGKGGVGKSTVTAQLALSLAAQGNRVGVLDIDICGPSIPKILGLEGREVHQCSEGWVPVYSDVEKRLGCMSIGFLLKGPDDAVVWRGPKKTAMIRQFVEDVFWDQLDYLIIDTPPGTTDEHISIAEVLMKCNPDGAIIVTTPQGVSLSDVRKEIRFCQTTKIPIIGIVENMSGFACPCCGEITNIFSKGGGEELSKQYSVPFLGAVPLDPQLGTAEDQGEDFVRKYPDSASAKALLQIVNKLLVSVGESPVETITTTTTTTETTTPMSNGDNNNNGN